MARINIEDSLWSDARFLRFCVRTGNEATAIGYVVMAFKLAQKHWCPEKRPVPVAEWSVSGIPRELIDCGLAEERPDGIYVRGSESQFAWWFQRVEAGKKGGRPKAEANRKKPAANRELSERKRAEPSSSSSSSFSSSFSNSLNKTAVQNFENSAGPPEENAAAKAPAPVHEFIAAYCENFKTKFGSNPPIVGQDAGIAKRMVKDLGLERAKALVGAYFGMSNAFYQERKYDLATFESNLKAIAVKYDTGQSFNRTQGRQQEIRDANVEAARAYLAAKGAS